MITIDSSVWIDYFNGVRTPETDEVSRLAPIEPILVGDLILVEVLQGFRDQREFENARRRLIGFSPVAMLSPRLAIKSAENYRTLRRQGITVRATIDLLIATYCIEGGHKLLHCDRDYDPFERHLGLQVLHPSEA